MISVSIHVVALMSIAVATVLLWRAWRNAKLHPDSRIRLPGPAGWEARITTWNFSHFFYGSWFLCLSVVTLLCYPIGGCIVFLGTLLIAMFALLPGELVPRWVWRRYLFIRPGAATVHFKVRGGDWESKKAFLWLPDGSGLLMISQRDITTPVQIIPLPPSTEIPTWHRGRLAWDPPNMREIRQEEWNETLDPAFSAHGLPAPSDILVRIAKYRNPATLGLKADIGNVLPDLFPRWAALNHPHAEILGAREAMSEGLAKLKETGAMTHGKDTFGEMERFVVLIFRACLGA